jgi:dihydroflavonol-4-reductase
LPAAIEVVRADIRDRDAVRSALAGGRFVYHLAANPNLWARDRREFDAVNHHGTVNVLDAALEAGAERVLHTSTESILTRARSSDNRPIAEDVEVSLADAVGPYCRSKLRAENEAMARARAGKPIVIANPTMPVGPGDRLLSPPTRLIRDFCRARARRSRPAVSARWRESYIIENAYDIIRCDWGACSQVSRAVRTWAGRGVRD